MLKLEYSTFSVDDQSHLALVVSTRDAPGPQWISKLVWIAPDALLARWPKLVLACLDWYCPAPVSRPLAGVGGAGII